MRFREKDATSTSRTYEKSWLQNGSYVFNTTATYTRSQHWNRMLDVVTPSFYRERNKGGIICSPMFKDSVYFDKDHTTFVATGRYNKTQQILVKNETDKGLDGVCPVAGISSDGASSEMSAQLASFDREISLAITRAHADVNLSEMNLIASVGELPETIAWIRNIVKRILDLTKVFRAKAEVRSVSRMLQYAADESPTKFNIKRLERYIALLQKRKASARPKNSIDKTVFNLWLEYRYALRPLIYDLQSAIKALDASIVSKRLVARGREYVVGETSSSGTVDPTPAQNSVGVVYTKKVSTNIKARAGCLYIVDAQLASMLDILGLDQPVEALYELIPLSFMLDWVFSVGDLLNSWFKSSGLSILTSWVTLSVEVNQTCKVTSATLYPQNTSYTWPNQQFVLGSSHIVVKRKWRMPNPALPLLPRFDLKINLAKLIDLGAIARNVISGDKIPAVVRRS